ncbi:MAG: peptide deformylase, partial [Polaromonas sp.]|uniref:peptide deformylase n=1 Tax=Polaromonas sp. TaxID=1869339 RepID=UPI0040372402
MKKILLLTASHLVVLLAGFVLGVYLLPILTAPDLRLKKKSLPVDTVDAGVRQLMDDMLETMYDAPGIGLAAPQVGVLKRVVVLDIDREDTKTGGPLFMANPEIVEASDEDVS